MALPDLDPRNGGACGTCLANKFLSYVMGYVQLALWICSLLTVMFDPSSIGKIVESKNQTEVRVVAVIILLLSIVFSVLLLVGLHKGRPVFIKSYCVYAGAYVVLLALSLIIKIVQPQRLAVGGFFSTIVYIIIQMFFFLVLRSYYLLAYCNGGARQAIIPDSHI